MKIYLVRHASTEKNEQDLLQGLQDVRLSEKGQREARSLRMRFHDMAIDACYSSPLLRAFETAMILVGHRVEIIKDERLLERYLGEFEGKKRSLYDPKLYWNIAKNCGEKGVEPAQEVLRRAQEFLDEIYQKHANEQVLVVSHAAMIRALHYLLMDKKVDILALTIPNGCLLSYDYHQEKKNE